MKAGTSNQQECSAQQEGAQAESTQQKGFVNLLFREYHEPPKGDKTICIYSHNVSDGVGDTACLFPIAQQLQQMKDEHGARIVGVVTVAPYSPYKTLINIVNENCSLFDEFYFVSDDNIFLQMQTDSKASLMKGKLKAEESMEEKRLLLESSDSSLVQALSTCKLFVDVMNANTLQSCGSEFLRLLPDDCPRRRITELGCVERYFRRPTTPESHVLKVNIGEGGIWINEPPNDDLPVRAERLLNFENTDYLKRLTGSNNPTRETVQAFLRSHKFMPGYVQNELQGVFFILSHILKYSEIAEDGSIQLMEHCDFHLPKGAVDIELIQRALSAVSLDTKLIKLVTPDEGVEALSAEPCIRILTGFFLSKEDYENIYHISSDGAACSGDNSFSQVISSNHPLFVAGLGGKGGNQFMREFASQDLLRYLQNRQNTLTDYAEIMLGKAPECWSMHPKAILVEEDFVTIIDLAKKLGKIMQNSKFEKEFAQARRTLLNNHNIAPNFREMISCALETPKPNPSRQAMSSSSITL